MLCWMQPDCAILAVTGMQCLEMDNLVFDCPQHLCTTEPPTIPTAPCLPTQEARLDETQSSA